MNRSLELQLKDYRLTTAEIIYRLPDHPSLLPMLRKFLGFWERNLDGQLHLVRVAGTKLIKPAEFRFARGEFLLN